MESLIFTHWTANSISIMYFHIKKIKEEKDYEQYRTYQQGM